MRVWQAASGCASASPSGRTPRSTPNLWWGLEGGRLGGAAGCGSPAGARLVVGQIWGVLELGACEEGGRLGVGDSVQVGVELARGAGVASRAWCWSLLGERLRLWSSVWWGSGALVRSGRGPWVTGGCRTGASGAGHLGAAAVGPESVSGWTDRGGVGELSEPERSGFGVR